MSVATFDTLAAVRNLEKAGMGTSQAEAVTETIRIAVFQGVATKEDIAELRSEIGELRAETKADIGGLRAEMKADNAKLRAETQADIAKLRVEMKAETSDLRTGLEAVRAQEEKVRADLTWRMVMAMSVLLGIFTALDLFFLN